MPIDQRDRPENREILLRIGAKMELVCKIREILAGITNRDLTLEESLILSTLWETEWHAQKDICDMANKATKHNLGIE